VLVLRSPGAHRHGDESGESVNPTKAFVVLSMHRSASSLIAKGLHECGVHMGDRLLSGLADNPQGHFEDTEILAWHEQVLRQEGGTWFNPPARVHADVWLEDAARMVADRRQHHELWGFKDPRTAITWPIWSQALTGTDTHLVCIFRHPSFVARSLEARDGLHPAAGGRLAADYNRRILDAAARFVNEEVPDAGTPGP